jgi:hypothetical protein
MSSRVVFIDTLPTELRKLVEPHQVEIAAWWTKDTVCNELFVYHEDEGFYEWQDKGNSYPSKMDEFLGACLDWRDTLPTEEGHEVMDVILAVADSYIASEDTSYESQGASNRRKIRDEWLEALLKTHTQPLPED